MIVLFCAPISSYLYPVARELRHDRCLHRLLIVVLLPSGRGQSRLRGILGVSRRTTHRVSLQCTIHGPTKVRQKCMKKQGHNLSHDLLCFSRNMVSLGNPARYYNLRFGLLAEDGTIHNNPPIMAIISVPRISGQVWILSTIRRTRVPAPVF